MKLIAFSLPLFLIGFDKQLLLCQAFVTPSPLTTTTTPLSTRQSSGESSTARHGTPRRKALQNGGGFLLGSLLGTKKPQPANAATTTAKSTTTTTQPLADIPMVRLRLPQAALGREYVALQLKIQDQGPFDFMVDTGLTTEMISPHLQQSLGIATTSKDQVKGLGAGGSTSSALVPLKGAALCCGKDGQELKLPTLSAVVTDFPQEHIDPSHDPVEGMLGMELLSMYDVDLDFPAGRIRLWEPGTARAAATKAGLVEIPAVVINESGLYGFRLASAESDQPRQPVLGFIDCGSTFSALNWEAAKCLGLPTDRQAYANAPAITAIGIDGRPLLLPTRKTALSYVGNAQKTAGGAQFEAPPKAWKAWNPVQLAIGDLPVFKDLLGDGVHPYQGPAALIGLDILAQRRVILETSNNRQRRLWVSPK